MIIIGLTGGIGSGKTTVAKMFSKLDIPIYIADNEAKILMQQSNVIKQKLVALFGDQAYLNGALNKPYIANVIFNNKDYLQKMNAIVHPEVTKHFKKWVAKQKTPYVIKEVAILFENGSYKTCDFIITVTAPLEVKIKRLLKRDKTSIDKIEAIMKNQWTDNEKIKHSHYIIKNEDLINTKKQVLSIVRELNRKIHK